MTCAQVQSLLSSYLDGAVTGRQMFALGEHLNECVECRMDYAELRQTQQLLSRVGRAQAPDDLSLKVRLAISREAARRREIDIVLVWRLDRWGRSVTDLLATLQELEHLGVGFVSLTEALDLSTPAGRAMAGLLAIFAEFEREILRERTKAGLAHAREKGKQLGRPATAAGRSRRSGGLGRVFCRRELCRLGPRS